MWIKGLWGGSKDGYTRFVDCAYNRLVMVDNRVGEYRNVS